MREKWQKQMPLMPPIKQYTQAKELSAIIDATLSSANAFFKI